MRRLAKYVCGIVVLTGVMGFAGYRYFSGEDDARELGLSATESILEIVEYETEPIAEPVISDRAVLSADATITYRYKYLQDGYIESSSGTVPYFLVGLDREQLADRLMGWELVEFSSEGAVFEKTLNASRAANYTVGISNGYIAVFYDSDMEASGLKEQTEIPVEALPEDEIIRLTAGISVLGDEQLVRVLEDYSS